MFGDVPSGGCRNGIGSSLRFLFGIREDVGKTDSLPLNSAGALRKNKDTALYSMAEPAQKLFLLSFENDRMAADPEKRDDGLVFLKLAIKPLCPVRCSGKAVDLRQRHPHKRCIRVRQNSAPCAATVIDQFLGNADQMAQRFLPI